MGRLQRGGLTWDELLRLGPDNIVISPGPGPPETRATSSVTLEALLPGRRAGARRCLGHQDLAYVLGGPIEHAREVSGRLSSQRDVERRSLPASRRSFLAVRYHSLVVGVVPLNWG